MQRTHCVGHYQRRFNAHASIREVVEQRLSQRIDTALDFIHPSPSYTRSFSTSITSRH